MNRNNIYLSLAALALATTSASGAPLSGTFNITGTVAVNLLNVDWEPTGGTTGLFNTKNPATGAFVGIVNPNPLTPYNGTVKDLVAPPVPVPRFLDLFTAPGFGGLYFDLAMVQAPTAPPCSTVMNPATNVDCSFGTFTLQNTGAGVGITFAVLGFFQNGLDLTTRTPGMGLYSTQLVGDTVLNVVQTINGGGTVAVAYSANFSANPVPEPATMSMFSLAGGLIVFGAFRRRRQ